MSIETREEIVRGERRASALIKSVALPFMALLLALAGQWLLVADEANWRVAGTSFLAAVTLYLVSLWNWPRAALIAEKQEAHGVSWRPVVHRKIWLGLAVAGTVILATISYERFAGNRLDRGFWTWMGSLLLFFVAFARVPDCSAGSCRAAITAWWHQLDKRLLLALLVIVLLAIFFRFYRLQAVPLEMTSDHAEKILDVQDVLDGRRPIFFPRNTGRELLQFYVTAAMIRLFSLPNSHLTLKIGTAIFGVMAVPFTFLLGRLLYGRAVGLLAAFFLAISHWHVAITRVGLRFPFTAAFATPALFFLLRALRDNRRNDWLMSALFLGIGLHTYTAMRVVPVLCAALVAFKLLDDAGRRLRQQRPGKADALSHRFWLNVLLALSLVVLFLLPLLRYSTEDPLGVWARSLSRTLPDLQLAPGQLGTQLLINLRNALLMFNLRGDVVAMNTIPSAPVLGIVSGALFVLGIAYLMWRLLAYRDRRSIVVLTSLFMLLLPSILSVAYPGENPSVVRTGGGVPIVTIIAAIALVTLADRAGHGVPATGKWVAAAVFAVLLLAATYDNYVWYFRDYDDNIRYSIANATELGQVLAGFKAEGGDLSNAFHIPYPHWMDTRAIGINAGQVRWENAILDVQALESHVQEPRPRLYLMHKDEHTALQKLWELFPNGVLERHNSARVGRDFLIFRVPAEP